MTANIIYRASLTPVIAPASIAKNSPLSNAEMDGNLKALSNEIDSKAPSNSPTFAGVVVLPETTSIGNVSATEIGFLDGASSNLQNQINTKAPVVSPAFSGTPTAPTPAPGTSTTQLATTAFVEDALMGHALKASPVFTGTATAPQFVSTVTTGTPPFIVASSTMVPGLNADFLDGQSADVSATPSTMVLRDGSGNATVTNLNTSLADVGTVAGALVFRNAGALGYCSSPAAIRTFLNVPTGSGTISGTNTGDQTSVSGNAGTVTNGVYTIGDQTVNGTKTFSSQIVGDLLGIAKYVSSQPQTYVITGATNSVNIAQANTTNNGSFVCRASGASDGNSNLAGMTFYHDSYAIKMGVRADGMFGIGGWSRAAWSWYSDASGNTVSAGNMSGYSDPRLKDNVIQIADPFSLINSIRGVTFTWNERSKLIQGKWGKHDYGVLSSEVKAVMPEIITQSISDEETGDVYDTVDYTKLVPVLLEAIKQLKKEVDLLKAK